MADLFHLDEELIQPQHDEAEEVIDQTFAPEDVDDDQGDREIIDLPPALAQAAHQKTVEPLLQEDDRLDLQDFAVHGSLQERQEYVQLQHWWVQELQAPELLPWDGAVLAPLLEVAFSEQDDDNHNDMKQSPNNLRAILNDIRSVDKERVQFVVANLLQVRLRKIQACPWFYANHKERLSKAEALFSTDFLQLLDGHLQTSVTDHFPQEAWRRLDEPEMIEEPDLDQYVMVRVLEDCTLRKGSEEARTLEAESNLIVKYREIRTFLESGALELIM